METGIKVGDLMTRNLVWTSPDTDLRSCIKLMVKKKVGSLIIMEKGVLRGILTEKDIMWALSKKSKKDLSEIKAKDIMKRKLVTIKPSADIAEALVRFKKKKIRKFPVVENKKVIGMITLKDILKLDPGLFQLIAQSLHIREETNKLKRIGGGQQKHIVGVCEECGRYDLLTKDGEQWICEVCYNAR